MTTADSPLVSVVIPSYNGMAHLPVCLSSLHAQRYQPLEIILVDNGSTDDSVAYVRREFSDVRIISLAQNQVFAGAVNAGIRGAAQSSAQPGCRQRISAGNGMPVHAFR